MIHRVTHFMAPHHQAPPLFTARGVLLGGMPEKRGDCGRDSTRLETGSQPERWGAGTLLAEVALRRARRLFRDVADLLVKFRVVNLRIVREIVASDDGQDHFQYARV